MQHAAFKHIGDGFKAAVGVGREAADVVVCAVGVEFVEHQEGVETRSIAAAEYAGQAHAVAVRGRLPDNGFDQITVLSHGASPKDRFCAIV